MVHITVDNTLSYAGSVISQYLLKQISLPSPLRGLIEIAIFGGVFLAAGHISLGLSVPAMIVPVGPVVFAMMVCMMVSGVYRRDITNSIMNIYVHSAYGFLLASIVLLLIVGLLLPEYSDPKFVFFFLFFSFFVLNTIRPIVCGTDFMDGGGRRTN